MLRLPGGIRWLDEPGTVRWAATGKGRRLIGLDVGSGLVLLPCSLVDCSFLSWCSSASVLDGGLIVGGRRRRRDEGCRLVAVVRSTAPIDGLWRVHWDGPRLFGPRMGGGLGLVLPKSN